MLQANARTQEITDALDFRRDELRGESNYTLPALLEANDGAAFSWRTLAVGQRGREACIRDLVFAEK